MKRKVLVENEPRYFYCRDCDCFFEADKDDYNLVPGAVKEQIAMTICPNCGHEVYKEVLR